jgi:hypothetical protein
MDRVLQRHYRTPANQRLANHLIRERDAMFTFFIFILSRIGGDELPCRTSNSSDGGHAEGVGRKSHTAGSTHAKRVG